MSNDQNVRQAVGAVIVSGYKVLLVHKVKAMDGALGPEQIEGEWDFPKGGITHGEDVLQALSREIGEETGIVDFRVIEELHSFDFQFDEKFRKKLGYRSQHTRMFLLEYSGNIDDVFVPNEEINKACFYNEKEVVDVLHHDSCKAYYETHVRSRIAL
uniref:Dinucleoside polyphosphate hydrolase n=1 Tax=Candidatus Nitrotoga fabula TaxID=2182327 RepID=A0A2X0QT00_9PROT|nr:Dinucleoside polyphosphate hydrolase [Candidatus Nitrotoga fabula]